MRVIRVAEWRHGLFGSHMRLKGYQVQLRTGHRISYFLRAYDRKDKQGRGYAWFVYIGNAFVPLTNGFAPTLGEAKRKATEAARRDAARKEAAEARRRRPPTKGGYFGLIAPRREVKDVDAGW